MSLAPYTARKGQSGATPRRAATVQSNAWSAQWGFPRPISALSPSSDSRPIWPRQNRSRQSHAAQHVACKALAASRMPTPSRSRPRAACTPLRPSFSRAPHHAAAGGARAQRRGHAGRLHPTRAAGIRICHVFPAVQPHGVAGGPGATRMFAFLNMSRCSAMSRMIALQFQ